jgi:hypothetical protein
MEYVLSLQAQDAGLLWRLGLNFPSDPLPKWMYLSVKGSGFEIEVAVLG